jgi:hypothetical protein
VARQAKRTEVNSYSRADFGSVGVAECEALIVIVGCRGVERRMSDRDA